MKKLFNFILIALFLLTGCSGQSDQKSLQNVGLLVPETISDQVWGTKGYKGLLKIQSQFEVDVFYKEGMSTKQAVEQAVAEYDKKGVNLIFGHGQEYAPFFNEIAVDYPHIHFVSFNGNASQPNTTSLKFEGYAMGFFGGMTAANQSQTKNIGIVASYAWQPEVKGFIEGAEYQDSNVDVVVDYTDDWDHTEKAMVLLHTQLRNGVDIVYPAGDGYNIPIIEKLKEKGLHAVGYVSDQSDMGESTVLTSTVQHVDKLYEVVAERYSNDTLKSGNIPFDFQDGVISMGKFSPAVDEQFRENIETDISHYIKMGQLPNERKDE
ncbi:BMP family ABC transporter substrate-binding protein [Rossellomorea vietnamensis]|uniref:BMP family ABC transporter substrate-binding protein n=1 Tax=Rossellomorea vietnamensis TaxID=218284 RepID=A0A5D4MEI4_9BACI|nr:MULTISPECIES: BMP family ABC transporter substrate-binding protein [Bacillaceae]TYR99435.1 BMP family ABC transporter substrate-binding protein [Rossellomorea vietnamensis]